jgi:hypothetical protein
MNPPLYNEVLQLSQDFVNASEIGDTKAEWNAYQKLKMLCETNENTDNNHPIQWEALADFTTNTEQAIVIYKNALNYAEQLNLGEYTASICLALAERYIESGNHQQARSQAIRANNSVSGSKNTELRKEISGFLQSIDNIA